MLARFGLPIRWLSRILAAGCITLFVAQAAMAQRPAELAAARQQLVEQVKEAVSDPRVLEAIGKTERHLFVPADQRKNAYFDMALPIGHNATISPPGIVGFMTEQLDPQPTDKVLEIGTGSGYQAAILSPLVDKVYTIEITEPLGRRAAARLKQLGYDNVFCKVGDGYEGWPEHAPFDKIIVTCSPEKIPVPLVEQLREGGMMVIPLGERFQQSLCLVRKTDGELHREVLESTFFIPMTGKAEELRERLGDEATPQLENGGFEETTARGVPLGWYYLRQAELISDGRVHAGQRSMRFASESRERTAHALQAFGCDGQRFRQIRVSMMVRLDRVPAATNASDLAGFQIHFYDDRRMSVGSQIVGPWTGTSDWSRREEVIRIPPRAKLAVLGIGLFGLPGEMLFDDVQVEAVSP